MKYSRKGHKDRNGHKNRIKGSGQARLVNVTRKPVTSPPREGEPTRTVDSRKFKPPQTAKKTQFSID